MLSVGCPLGKASGRLMFRDPSPLAQDDNAEDSRLRMTMLKLSGELVKYDNDMPLDREILAWGI